MSLGPHPDGLRGELALERVRAVQEATWPGVQRDLELRRVREVAQVLVAMPGRYRAWVLILEKNPHSNVIRFWEADHLRVRNPLFAERRSVSLTADS